jgi:hypothetical protein
MDLGQVFAIIFLVFSSYFCLILKSIDIFDAKFRLVLSEINHYNNSVNLFNDSLNTGINIEYNKKVYLGRVKTYNALVDDYNLEFDCKINAIINFITFKCYSKIERLDIKK